MADRKSTPNDNWASPPWPDEPSPDRAGTHLVWHGEPPPPHGPGYSRVVVAELPTGASPLERFCAARWQLNAFLNRSFRGEALAEVHRAIDPRLDAMFQRLANPPPSHLRMALDAIPKGMDHQLWSALFKNLYGNKYSVAELRQLRECVEPFVGLEPSLEDAASARRERLCDIRDAAIRAALDRGINPGRNMKWAEFRVMIAQECGVTADDYGFSTEYHFWRVVKAIRAGKR